MSVRLERLTAPDPQLFRRLADLFGAARLAAMPELPVQHTPAENAEYLQGCLPDSEIWLARDAQDGLLGFIVFDADWIDHLYLAPSAWRQGIGTQLVLRALADGRARQLWCFQENRSACAFYESLGFVAVESTAGEANEEKRPDVRYRHPGLH